MKGEKILLFQRFLRWMTSIVRLFVWGCECVRARACVSMVLDFMIGSPPFYTGLMGSNRGAWFLVVFFFLHFSLLLEGIDKHDLYRILILCMKVVDMQATYSLLFFIEYSHLNLRQWLSLQFTKIILVRFLERTSEVDRLVRHRIACLPAFKWQSVI